MAAQNLGLTTDSRSAVDFFAGDHPRVQDIVIIASGQAAVLPKGTVLGKITATGKYKPYAAANTDGSQTAKLILAEDADAVSADANALVYAHGEFNKAALTGIDSAAITSLREVGIYIKEIK